MEIERERKYLVKSMYKLVDMNLEFSEIIQLYLDEDCNVRLRWKNNPYLNTRIAWMSYKEFINDTDRKEYEFNIKTEDFLKVFNNNNYRYMLSKKRAFYKGWEIDVYPFGLVVAEFEYSDVMTIPDPLPDWISKDITGMKEYSNIYIAKNWDKLNEKSLSDNC